MPTYVNEGYINLHVNSVVYSYTVDYTDEYYLFSHIRYTTLKIYVEDIIYHTETREGLWEVTPEAIKDIIESIEYSYE